MGFTGGIILLAIAPNIAPDKGIFCYRTIAATKTVER
jgi:hypothetical protein